MLKYIEMKCRDKASRCRTVSSALLTTAIFMLSSGAVSASGSGAHWSYTGQEGPANWGLLAEEYRLCGSGINQSPINIDSPSSSNLFKLEFNYSSVPLQIVNNGHTIQINYNTTVDQEKSTIEIEKKKYHLPSATSYNSSISISGEEYKLLQVHFHSPSEHHVTGNPYAMEAHFVHANSAGQLAVVGVFLKEGKSNKFIGNLWSQMPHSADGVHTLNGIQLNAEDLLPENRGYYHYRGSLTTPPCSEGVRWFVMRTPAEVSSSQVSKFLSVINKNARPVQQVNARFLLNSK